MPRSQKWGCVVCDEGEIRDDVRVTDEMIEAGCAHLYRYHAEFGVGDRETVVRIFLSMLRLLKTDTAAVHLQGSACDDSD